MLADNKQLYFFKKELFPFMAMNNIYNYYFVFILFVFFSCGQSGIREAATSEQEEVILEFIDYQDFEKVFRVNRNSELITKKFDLVSILLLDSTNAEILFKLDPKLEEDFHYAMLVSRLSMSTVGFVTDLETLRDVLLSKEERDMIITCVHGEGADNMKYNIGSPVYIKNNTAIIQILGPSSVDDYYVTINSGVVQLNFLGGIIED
ncbi:hypothetical protein [Dyadobacter psychrotolerans]|uniref:Uncharacterized protein n=1 Tax=Dyadobacter psychrotolerans TaxID=2541721 RepID=A0A4V2Z4Y3_9BACT|nr:hypothetical protein [Dyadobacter psychrotolerans]TDE18548.1 hypothetical protein E0F88_03140 [Dyadobacter psychrotolerans]